MAEKTFTELYDYDVSEHVSHLTKEYERNGEKKSFTLDYLQWAAGVKYLAELDPESRWEVREWDGRPYLDVGRGALVYVSVTLFGKTKGTYLPVMDQKYNPIEDPDAFDINTAHWRCFVKALALHGLGLKLYMKDAPKGETQSNATPLEPGPAGSAVMKLPVTVTKVADLGKYGKRLSCLTDDSKSVVIKAWFKEIANPPGQGEHVAVDGTWEIEEKYGASIKAIRFFDADEASPKTSTHDGHSAIPDTPANRAAVLKKYKSRAQRAEELGIKFTPPESLKGKTLAEMTDIGKDLADRIEKAERDQYDTGSQAPETDATQEWPV